MLVLRSELYRRLLQTYPGFARNDAVLYQLARALDADGQPDESAATLARLVTEHPQSALVDEAWFRRAEALFMAKRWPEAQAAYQSVIQRGPSGAFHEQALYKQGWTLFKQSENEASIGPFLALLDAFELTQGLPLFTKTAAGSVAAALWR